jgi:hypothetical protein
LSRRWLLAFIGFARTPACSRGPRFRFRAAVRVCDFRAGDPPPLNRRSLRGTSRRCDNQTASPVSPRSKTSSNRAGNKRQSPCSSRPRSPFEVRRENTTPQLARARRSRCPAAKNCRGCRTAAYRARRPPAETRGGRLRQDVDEDRGAFPPDVLRRIGRQDARALQGHWSRRAIIRHAIGLGFRRGFVRQRDERGERCSLHGDRESRAHETSACNWLVVLVEQRNAE